MSRRSIAPAPDVFNAILNEVSALVSPLKAEYEAIYPSGYEKARRGRSGGNGRNDNGVQSNLADSMQGTQSYVRDKLDDAGRSAQRALDLLKGAMGDLGKAQDAIDPDSVEIVTTDDRHVPHPATHAEIAEARRARDRRDGRYKAGVFGSSDEIGQLPPGARAGNA